MSEQKGYQTVFRIRYNWTKMGEYLKCQFIKVFQATVWSNSVTGTGSKG